MSSSHLPTEPASQPEQSAQRPIVFVVADVSDYSSLLAGLAHDAEVHVLDAAQDGLAQMAQILQGRGDIDALHIISHGSEGAVSLGSLQLTSDALAAHADDLATIRSALVPGADILLYGCDVGAGSNGAAFVEELAKATGADVAASTDSTGAAKLGGNWVLEKSTGVINAWTPFSSASLANYANILATTGTWDGTYEFGGQIGANDSAGEGFATYSDKFVISNGFDIDGPTSIYYGASQEPSASIVIKAEGGSTAKTFTFKDFSFSLLEWGSGITNLAVDALTIITKDADGGVIGTHTMPPQNGPYAPGTTAQFSASSLINNGVVFNDTGVASVTINWTVGPDPGYPNAYAEASYLAFHSITIADVSAEEPGDNTPPVVESITRATPVSGATNLASLQYLVTFSEEVTGVNAGDFTVTGTTGATGTVQSANSTDNGKTWTVTVNNISGTGTLRLDLKNSGTGIADLATNPVASGYTGGDTYTVDRTAPAVASIVRATSGTGATNATSVEYTVTFSENVVGVGKDDFVLNRIGTANGTIDSISGSGNTYTVTVNGISGDGTLRLDLKNSGTGIADLAGNPVAGGYASGQAYTFDHTPPQVTSITRTGAETTKDASVTYRVTFSDNVTGVDTADFTLNKTGSANGTVASITPVNGSTYDVTVNGITGDGTLRLDLKAGTNVIDGAGNVASGYTSGQAYDVDRIVPIVDSVDVPAFKTYRAGEHLDFTVHYSETVSVDTTNGTPSIDIVLDTGGTVKAVYVGGSGSSALSFRYTVKPGDADANGVTITPGIDLNSGTICDAAGNNAALMLAGVGPSSGVLVNALAPTVTAIERVGDALTNATSITYTVTFSESVTGVDAGDFTLVANGVSGTIGAVSGGGDTWSVTVDNLFGNGELRLDLNASGTGIVGSSGQAIGGGYTSGQVVTIDQTAPQLSAAIQITDDALKVGETTTVTFRFTEAVANFTIDDVNVANATLSNLASSDGGKTWTATLTPDTPATAAGNELSVKLDGIADLAGNAGVGTSSGAAYDVDTVRPSLVSGIAISDRSLAIGDTATVTFTFNEKVVGLDVADIAVPNGSLSTPVSPDGGKTWTATLTPSEGRTSASNTLTLDYSGIMDEAGNAGTGTAYSEDYKVDTVRPALASSIAISDTTLTSGDTATVTFTFTEAVRDFTVDHVTVPNGTLSDLTPSQDGTTWTATLTPKAGTNAGTNILTLDYAGITDTAGNAGVGTVSSGNYVVNTTAPVLATPITISNTELAIGGSATVTFVFNEAVTGFDLRDVTAPHGSLKDLTTDDNITWTATLTPNANATQAGNVLTLDYSGIANGAGNIGVGTATSVGYDVDTVRPSLASSIGISDTELASGQTATVTFTFNEAVAGFTVENVTVPNGTLSNLQASDDGTTWTATLTPKAGTNVATNVLTLDYAGITDLAGNAATGSIDSGNYAVDTTAPALAQPIAITDTALKTGDTATVTFVFDQVVTDFTAADVTVPNGTLSAPVSNDGITWTATLTPTPGATAAGNVLTVNYAGIRNEAGNAGIGTQVSGTYAVDTRAPTATVTLTDVDLRAGESAQLTIAFSEIVSGFDKSAVTAPNGTLGEFTTTDDGKTWSATFTPSANTTAASNVVSVRLAGVSDLAGNPGAGKADSPSYAVRTAEVPAEPPVQPPATGTVDGVKVETGTLPVDPATGVAGKVLTVPVITGTRAEDPTTPNGNLADIPLGLGSGNGPRTGLLVSLPVGTGMRAEGPSALLTNEQALLDLIRRIENQTEDGSSAQLGMTGNGTGFLGSLAPDTLLQSQTLVLASAPGVQQTILINGSSTTPVGGGQNATAIGLVIDTTALPGGSTLQLNNVDFAAIVGAATVRGGEGRNVVTGDDASQNIFLGADDDALYGGGGNDVIGSAGGDDLLDGGSGNDTLVGGIGNDHLVGGAGGDVLQGSRSSQGGWEFYLGADGTLSARHDTVLFAPGQQERLALGELNGAAKELAFLDADKSTLSSLSLLYHAAFGRAPDLGGLSFWALGGAGIETVAAHFLRSAEWQAAGGATLSDADFIETLYQNVFGRAPDDGGRAFWSAKLAGTAGEPAVSRAEVLVAVSQSEEHKLAWDTADGYLIGEATVGVENNWIAGAGDNRLDGGLGSDVLMGGDGADIAVYAGKTADYKFIIDTDGRLKVEDKANGDLDQLFNIDTGAFNDGTLDLAFLQGDLATLKHLGLLYQAVLDRAGDLGGFQWWLGRDLDAMQLAEGFVRSDEFKARYDGISDALFVQALYDNSGLDAGAAGGKAGWESYLATHTRAELIASWVATDDVANAQFAGPGLWLV